MNTITMIAIAEGVLLLILIILIIFRKIGRPLNKEEIEKKEIEKLAQKEKKLEAKLKKEKTKIQRNNEKYARFKAMEKEAKSLQAPITLLSYEELFSPKDFGSLTLQDANGKIVHFENHDNHYRNNPCPTVCALATASSGRNAGTVIVK